VAAAQTRHPPNVLLFFSDQESGLLPGPARLPNRARLLASGVEFTHAFCNTPQCSPARATLLTGLDPHKGGVLTNVDANSLGKPLDPSITTIGHVFERAGYATGYFGKWHLGGDREGLRAFGFAASDTRAQDPHTVAAAGAWIRQQKGPWFACVSLINPHDIYGLPNQVNRVAARAGVTAPATGLDNLVGKPREQQEYVDKDQGRATRHFTPEQWIRYRSYYLELVEMVDAQLGEVLAAVPDLRSTVVAYTTDHGDALGEHGLPFKGPFMYEELVRIPLILSGPGVGGGRRSDLVTQAGIGLMLARAAGLRWPGNAASPSRDAVFLEYYAKQKWVNPIRTIRTRRWKLNWYDSGNKELYDLVADPHEKVNRAGETQVANIQSQLERRLAAWRGPLTKTNELA
jgi:glucosamine-6-phosphate deaminase